jgi:hypothetical protein
MKKKVVQYGLDEQGRMGITAVSLVDFPAIEVDFVFLRSEQTVKLAASEERRMLFGPALIPDKEILRRSPDGEEYFIVFPKSVVEQAAHAFLKKNQHHNATLMHQYPVTGLAVVESWVKEDESDKSVKFGFDLPVGTWFIGMKVDDEEIWNEVKDGTFKGFSIEGMFKEIGVDLSALEDEQLLAELARLIEEV